MPLHFEISKERSGDMVVEWLKVEVPVELREAYIQTDAAIWTPVLAACSGFISKQVWLNPQQENEVILVIHWKSREAWKSIPVQVLQDTEQQFSQAMGRSFPFVEAGEYQVRKFPQTAPK